jgi:magnesium transporter
MRDTAGGIMHKELVKMWKLECAHLCKEMRIQAENISRVHSIYVVDDEDRLKGRLKDLLTSSRTPIMMCTSEIELG